MLLRKRQLTARKRRSDFSGGMNTGNVYIHPTALSQTGVPQVLREGSSVFVRVIAQTGPRTFTAGFAGGRYTVDSDLALKPGMTFTAELRLKDGKVMLVPQLLSETGQQFVQNIPADVSAGIELSPQLKAYFISLGLVPDSITLRLFQQMIQLGSKFDAQFMQKARLLAKRFPGSEEEAADAALVLEQKGIRADVDTITELFCNFEFSGEQQQKKEEEQKRNISHIVTTDHCGTEDDVCNADIDSIVAEVKSFFTSVLSGKSLMYQQNTSGLLTVFNHLRTAHAESGDGSWLQIPFEFSTEMKKYSQLSGKGIFRFFTGQNEGKYKKSTIKIDFHLKSYFFVLSYIGKRCSKVRFSVLPVPSEEERNRQNELLQSLLGIKAEWADPCTISGFCSDEVTVSVVRGTV
jgi:hypothetical protein